MTARCAACGSDQLLHRTRLLKLGVAPGEIMLDLPPAGAQGRGQSTGLRALTCVGCGHVQIHAKDLDALREAYERQQESALGIK
jgi:hypothetical protein